MKFTRIFGKKTSAMPWYCGLLLLPLLALSPPASLGDATQRLTVGNPLPPVEGRDIDDRRNITLPAAAGGRPIIGVFSFSRAAAQPVGAWVTRLLEDARLSGYNVYQIPVISDVPSTVRAAIRYSIRTNTPAKLHPRIVLMFEGQTLWKARFNVDDDTVAYLVATDAQGQIKLMQTGKFSEEAYVRFLRALEPSVQ